MSQKDIIRICRDLGCCDACCLRYIGVKNPNAYKNSKDYILQYLDSKPTEIKAETDENIKKDIEIITVSNTNNDSSNAEDSKTVKEENNIKNSSETEQSVKQENDHTNSSVSLNKNESLMDVDNHTLDSTNAVREDDISSKEDGEDISSKEVNNTLETPPCKKKKLQGICVCCLGILQSDSWPDSVEMVKDVLEKKGYESGTFSCALSAPMCTLLREKVLALTIAHHLKDYDARSLTALKEAWKWSFGVQLAALAGKELDSGAIAPLMVTLSMEYPDDLQELEILKTLAPKLFSDRSRQRRRFAVEFTRRSVEQALEGVGYEDVRGVGLVGGVGGTVGTVGGTARCVSVAAAAQPMYLGGRYIKLSRELPQTPWLVNGVRMMDSSVQEIIHTPIAAACRVPEGEVEWRLKFMAAGREDVDVRCLGDGRPFAIEISDPRRQLSEAELEHVCSQISLDGRVLVHQLQTLTREDLTELKKGEETKCKTYEALCIKLGHSHTEMSDPRPESVSPSDLSVLSSQPMPLLLTQRTPIRVLHRRPLLTRSRYIYQITAEAVPDHPQLLVLRIRTQAGTYVKEWVHGELGRTQPSLGSALGPPGTQWGTQMDLLALDVTEVHLSWPPIHKKTNVT